MDTVFDTCSITENAVHPISNEILNYPRRDSVSSKYDSDTPLPHTMLAKQFTNLMN